MRKEFITARKRFVRCMRGFDRLLVLEPSRFFASDLAIFPDSSLRNVCACCRSTLRRELNCVIHRLGAKAGIYLLLLAIDVIVLEVLMVLILVASIHTSRILGFESLTNLSLVRLIADVIIFNEGTI